MKYGSVCSGIEAASVAWEPLGMQPSWFCEINAFPSAVLSHHWPYIPNLGDMNNLPELILNEEIEAPSILVGGTPCQAFSVAGLRNSLNDSRGQLTIKFIEIANAIDTIREQNGQEPCIIVWENVPGVLSAKDNAFGCFLGGIVGESEILQSTGKKWTNAGAVLGPQRQAAWRTLDAQYFGVPQRRKRIFLVASARKEFRPDKILFEQKSLSGNFEKSKKQRENIASFTASSFGQYEQVDKSGTIRASGGDCGHGSETIIAEQISKCLTTGTGSRIDYESESFIVHGTQDPCVSKDTAFTVGRNNGAENVITTNMQVRRLTPLECERLQGFPDNHTLVPYKGRLAADSPRYKACGNSMAVPVMKWIGKRILDCVY